MARVLILRVEWIESKQSPRKTFYGHERFIFSMKHDVFFVEVEQKVT